MFDKSKITSVYSGRKGCACGCKGKYSYASAYCYEGDDCVSDRSVSKIAKTVEDYLRDGSVVKRVRLAPGGDWLAVDLYHDRTYTLYFAEDGGHA